ncbi:MAG: hypothetical protein H0X65_13555, partial [Gemmatimonadetes bacterium]|nr:hypothetical protein [Gemmatimonadota bacterium]
MPLPSSNPGRIPAYDLSEPTEEYVRAALERVFGPDGATDRWSESCRLAGLVSGNVDTGSQLQRALRVLAEQGGPAAVTARSMQLRMSTYA